MLDRVAPGTGEMPVYLTEKTLLLDTENFCAWSEPLRVYRSGVEITLHVISRDNHPVILDCFGNENDPGLIRIELSTDAGETSNCADFRAPQQSDYQPVIAVRTSSATPDHGVAVLFCSPLPETGFMTLSLRYERLGIGEELFSLPASLLTGALATQ